MLCFVTHAESVVGILFLELYTTDDLLFADLPDSTAPAPTSDLSLIETPNLNSLFKSDRTYVGENGEVYKKLCACISFALCVCLHA